MARYSPPVSVGSSTPYNFPIWYTETWRAMPGVCSLALKAVSALRQVLELVTSFTLFAVVAATLSESRDALSTESLDVTRACRSVMVRADNASAGPQTD